MGRNGSCVLRRFMQQAHLVVGGVGHAALDRVGVTGQPRVGRARRARPRVLRRRRAARVEVGGHDLQLGDPRQRGVDRVASVDVAFDPYEILDLGSQPVDLVAGVVFVLRRTRRRRRLGIGGTEGRGEAGLDRIDFVGLDPRVQVGLHARLRGHCERPPHPKYRRGCGVPEAGRGPGIGAAGTAEDRDEHDPSDDQGQSDEAQDDPGFGHAVARLAALRRLDLGPGDESEDDRHDRTHAEDPAHDAQDHRGDRQPVGLRAVDPGSVGAGRAVAGCAVGPGRRIGAGRARAAGRTDWAAGTRAGRRVGIRRRGGRDDRRRRASRSRAAAPHGLSAGGGGRAPRVGCGRSRIDGRRRRRRRAAGGGGMSAAPFTSWPQRAQNRLVWVLS